jgi:hypothetical protein
MFEVLLDNPLVSGYTTKRLGSSRLFPRRAVVVIPLAKTPSAARASKDVGETIMEAVVVSF